jgi:hypothetical protein
LRRLSGYEKLLVLVFVLSLPLSNPWVRGDGVGYYAYVRSMLIEGRLDFEKDWQHGNESFVMGRLDEQGRVLPGEFTSTGHIADVWSVGPSLLWAPFLAVTHAGVLMCDRLGAHIAADGFSTPYLITMAVATSFFGFLGLWISYRLARKYFAERWAFLATLGIWWGSSLPVYMYFNPSWSHAHSAFVDSLFLWYWERTRGERTIGQWILLGLISGLMVNVYYPNGVLLTIPLMEAGARYWQVLRMRGNAVKPLAPLFLQHVIYFCTFVIALLPTLISRKIIFGSPVHTGYSAVQEWAWGSPALWSVLFSSDHGMLSWTPILILALIGLGMFRRADRAFANYMIIAAVAFYLVVALHPDWDGMSSFGNRFFVSLTPLFVLGQAAFFDYLARAWQERRAAILASTTTGVLILWNLGLIFQWGTHLIPARGPISWRDAAYNQVAVVPERAVRTLKTYLTRRKQMMGNIEEEDLKQIKSQEPDGTK